MADAKDSKAATAAAAGSSGASTFSGTPLPVGSSRKGAKQWQEDSFFHFVSVRGTVVIGGVFDGHGGYNGLVASTTARDFSVSYFDKFKAECETWTDAEWTEKLTALFHAMHSAIRDKFVNEKATAGAAGADAKSPTAAGTPPGAGGAGAVSANKRYVDEKGIVRSPSADPIHGGSTGTMVVFIRNADADKPQTIITANVGDSTALIIPLKGKPDFLTVDHGPESADEFLRVQKLPADEYPHKLLYVYDKTNVFRKYECPLVFLENGTKDPVFVQNPWGSGLHPTNVRYEPAVYAVTPRQINKDSTCIAMTRALGDFYAHQFGLTCEPSIVVKKVASHGDFSIVLGSDGIWDCWKFDDFGDYVNTCINKEKSLSETCEIVLNESVTRAITNFGAKHYDDACLVILSIPTPAAVDAHAKSKK